MRFLTLILVGFMAVSTTQVSASTIAPAAEIISEYSPTVAPMLQGNDYGRCVARANMVRGQGYAKAAALLARLSARGKHQQGRDAFNQVRSVTDVRFATLMRRCDVIKAQR